MFAGIVQLVVDAKAQGQVRVFRWGADQDAFRAPFRQMQLGFVAAGEEAGRFQNDIHAKILPRQIAGIAFFQDFNLMAAHDDVFGVVADFAVEFAVNGVPFEQVREG
jgi:hypothetical protein